MEMQTEVCLRELLKAYTQNLQAQTALLNKANVLLTDITPKVGMILTALEEEASRRYLTPRK